MMDMGDALIECLEYIILLNGRKVRGKELSYEIIDGVLHFYVTYSVILMDNRKDDPMKNYGLKVGVRNDK